MTIVVPVLDVGSDTTSDSFISGPMARGRALLANYLVTDKFQSYSFSSRVYSSVSLIQETPDSDTDTLNSVYQDLTALYGLHFDSVDLAVEYSTTNRHRMDISISWTEKGQRYSFIQSGVSLTDNLTYIVNEHNTGNPNAGTKLTYDYLGDSNG